MQHCLDRQDGMVVAKATLRILLYFLLQAKTFLHQLLEQIVKSQSCSYVEITARTSSPRPCCFMSGSHNLTEVDD